MAKIIIKIEKEDIKTHKLGCNIYVSCENNIDLIFTRDALKELIKDYNYIIIEEPELLGDGC